jgi:hypothetical protein
MFNFLGNFFSSKSIETLASRLVNKYTAQSFGFFGTAFLIYASANNLDRGFAEFIALSLQSWDINNFDILINFLVKIFIYIILGWLVFLTIDNLFRKSTKEPTILMLLIKKLINKKKSKSNKNLKKKSIKNK